MMYISITIEAGGHRFDISTDNRGSAAAAFEVLKEKNMVNAKTTPALFKSMLLCEWIDSRKPLGVQGVVSGDLLVAKM